MELKWRWTAASGSTCCSNRTFMELKCEMLEQKERENKF